MQKDNEHTYDNGWHPKEVHLKQNYKFYNQNFFFVLVSHFFLWITRLWLLIPRWFMGLKVKGKKNKKNVKGAIIVCNHINPLDSFFLVTSFHIRKIYITMLESNLGFGFASKYMRLCAAVPIPTEKRLLRKFKEDTRTILKKGKNVVFFAEAALKPYCDHIRPFLPGAFHYAEEFQCPIIPCCFTFHRPKGIKKLLGKKKPTLHFNILEPYYIKNKETRKETIETATKEVHDIIEEYFIKHSDYFYKNESREN